MILPPRHEKEHDPTLVCKLIKLIYGLKQSLRIWYEKLISYLFFCDFKINNVDHSLFVKVNYTHATSILVYDDDLIITKNNEKNIRQIKSH
jgi:Reverse transcriptase (RNA-dependent DNA polymerase)